MAVSLTVDLSPFIPAGTSVNVYGDVQTQGQPPIGAVIAGPFVVDAYQEVDITGLVEDRWFVAGAQVSGVWRYIRFDTLGLAEPGAIPEDLLSSEEESSVQALIGAHNYITQPTVDSTVATAVASATTLLNTQMNEKIYAALGRPIVLQPAQAFNIDASYFNTEVTASYAGDQTGKLLAGLTATGAVSIGIRYTGLGTFTLAWDAGNAVNAPAGTLLKPNGYGRITRTGTNQYALDGDWTTAGVGSGGGGGTTPPPAPPVQGTISPTLNTSSAASVASGVTIAVPAGGTGNRCYSVLCAWDTGTTPDISSLITTPTAGWSKRQAAFGTANGLACFTADVADGAADPPSLVLNWTGGTRTTFDYASAVYNNTKYLDSAILAHAAADLTAPSYPNIQVQSGGIHVVASSNSAALDVLPPSGYTERVDLSSTAQTAYADTAVRPLATTTSGATQLTLPAALPGDTLMAIMYYDNASAAGDPNSGLTLTAASGNWAKKASATKWVSPFGSTVFQHRVAAGDVAPTINFSGGARGVGWIVVRVTDADATDAIQAFAVNGNASSDTSNAIFTAATDVARGLRLLVEVNNGGAVVTAPQSYTQRANFSNQGAVFTRTSDANASNITYRSRWDGTPVSGLGPYPLTKPPSAAVGELLVMTVDLSDDTGIALTAPGWTLIGLRQSPGAGGVAYYYRIEDGTALADLTWTTPGGGTMYVGVRILCYQNVDTTAPIAGFAVQTNTASTTVTGPTITTTVDGCMILWIGTNTNGQLITGPATYTARFTGNYDTQPYEKLQTTAGSTGTLNGTQPASTVSHAAIIALRPAKLTNTTASLAGSARLWNAYTIIVKPAAVAAGPLGFEMADRSITTSGFSGALSPTITSATNRSHVALSLSLAPISTGSGVPPTPTPTATRRYGTAVVDSELNNLAYANFVRATFDSLTARWQGKWAPMVGDGGAGLRNILSFCQTNHMQGVLHCAAWWDGTETPSNVTSTTNQAAMKALLEARVTDLITIAKAYSTPDPCMDLINEPWSAAGAVKSGPFATAYGGANTTALYQMYRDMALKARALWPELKIGVNEFLPDSARQAQLLAMATRFGPQSATLADRGLLDYVGLQWHPDAPTGLSQAAIETIIQQFNAIGVDVHISEIGIPGDTSSEWQNLFAAMGNKTNAKRGTIWGPTDAQSDVSGGAGSMPYNGNFTKKAYATYPEAWHAAGGVGTPNPTGNIVIALGGGGVVVSSVPTGTAYVSWAVMDNAANPTNIIYSSPNSLIGDKVPVATATAPGYVFVPPAGYPVVDAIADDANGLPIGVFYSSSSGGSRLTTGVINTPGTSPAGTTIPPAVQIVDNAGATWTLVGGVAYRNGLPTNSSNVTQLAWRIPTGGTQIRVFQQNSSGSWWYWDNSAPSGINPWTATSDPGVTPGGGGSGGGSSTPNQYFVSIAPPGNWGSPFPENMRAAGLYPWTRSEATQPWLDQWSSVGGKFSTIFLGLGGDLSAYSNNATSQSYADQLLSVCNRYKPLGAEILNEPYFYTNGSNYAAYVNLVRICYQTFKAAGSPCKVVAAWDGGATGPTGVSWGASIVSAGLLQYCDGVTIHPYAGANNAYANDLGGNDADRSKIIDCWNACGKPIWITELGWPDSGTGDSPAVTDSERAARITSFNDWVIANHRDKIVNWNYYHINGSYGVWGNESPKGPSAAALSAAIAKAAALV